MASLKDKADAASEAVRRCNFVLVLAVGFFLVSESPFNEYVSGSRLEMLFPSLAVRVIDFSCIIIR